MRRAQAPELPLSGFIIHSRCFSEVGGAGGGGKRPTSLSPASLTHSRGPEQSSWPAPPRATLFFLIFLLFLFFLCFSKCLDSVPLKSFSLPILLLFNFVFCFRSDSPYDAI